MEDQGYEVKDNILYQDNKSTILLLENGKRSSGKRTRHMNIRYFFFESSDWEGEFASGVLPHYWDDWWFFHKTPARQAIFEV